MSKQYKVEGIPTDRQKIIFSVTEPSTLYSYPSNHIVYFSLGTNLGNKEDNLKNAINLIAGSIGEVCSGSSVFETEPWGFDSDNPFYNMVICVKTQLPPTKVLKATQDIEKQLGRTEKSQNSYHDRIIDIDIILYDDLIYDTPALKIPHPLFHQRKFVLEPLSEIAPELNHPILKKTTTELLQSLQ